MESSSRVSLPRLVLVPGLITLAVTLARLTAELAGAPAWLAGAEGGGGGSILGISWLPPVFGLWFGHRLARGGRAPRSPWTASLAGLVGLALGFGAIAFWGEALMTDPEVFRKAMDYNPIVWWGATLLVLWRWPALWATGLLYGLSARLPVVAITCIAVPAGWGTHYEKPGPPEMAMEVPPGEAILMLSWAQLMLWVPMTILATALTAGLTAGRGRAAG